MNGEKQMSYIPSKYSRAMNQYTKTEIKSVYPLLNCISRHSEMGNKYPIFKILKAIAKIFLVNEIETIFLAHIIIQTDWDIRNKLITMNSQHVRDVVCCSQDQPQYKNLILYLVLATYGVKFYLNEETHDFLEEATKICPNFKIIFQNWAKKYSYLTKKISPKILNKVYENLFIKATKDEADYNILVDAIIQISPAYNPDKNNDKEKRKEEKKDLLRQKLESQSHKMVKLQLKKQMNSQKHNPIFSSSGLFGLGNTDNDYLAGYQSNNKNFNHHDKTFLGSSIIGMPECEIKLEEDDCQQLLVGLQNGESQENILIKTTRKNEITDVPQTSIINLSRSISITQKYLSDQVSKNS